MTTDISHNFNSQPNTNLSDSWIETVDIRVKALFLILFLTNNLLGRSVFISITLLSLSLLVTIFSNISVRKFIKKMVLPSTMALLIFLTQIFWVESGVLIFEVSLLGVDFRAWSGGLIEGSKLFCVILSSCSWLIVFSLSTSLYRLSLILYWFKIPPAFVEIGLLICRYIFLFHEEATKIISTQKTRLGYGTWMKRIESITNLGGILVIRSFDRAITLGNAQKVRCKNNKIVTPSIKPLKKTDYILMFAGVLTNISIYHVLS